MDPLLTVVVIREIEPFRCHKSVIFDVFQQAVNGAQHVCRMFANSAMIKIKEVNHQNNPMKLVSESPSSVYRIGHKVG